MNPKNLPAKLLAVLGVILAASIICSGIPALDPVRYTEADATATAIAPALYPTIQYNENVLPERQRVEREEITATTRNKEAWQRKVDKAAGVAKIIGLGAVVLCGVGVGIGIGGTAGARGVIEMRQAALPMTRLLIEGPHITESGTVTHTATGATWRIDAPSDARPEHARLVSATYKALPEKVLLKLLARQRAEWVKVDEQRLLT